MIENKKKNTDTEYDGIAKLPSPSFQVFTTRFTISTKVYGFYFLSIEAINSIQLNFICNQGITF